MSYVSNPACRVSNGSFGLAIVRNIGTPEAPEFDNGFKVYRAPDEQLWVTGDFGAKYGIEFIVPQYGRFKAVTAVDGRNILTGAVSSGSAREGAWIISHPGSRGSNIVPGWKQPGNNSVAAFVLAQPEHSYAVLTGSDESAVGVIAVQYYHEARQSHFRQPFETLTRGGVTRSAGMGTGYGADTQFSSSTTQFVPDYSVRPVRLVIRIAQEAELQAAGCVLVHPSVAIPGANADPFPGNSPGVIPPSGPNPHR